jgi:hypothetical protein
MAEIGRPELDAKLEAVEARTESRIARIENKLDIAIEAIKNASSDLRERIPLGPQLDGRRHHLRACRHACKRSGRLQRQRVHCANRDRYISGGSNNAAAGAGKAQVQAVGWAALL